LYCLVDMNDEEDLAGWYTFEKELCAWGREVKGEDVEGEGGGVPLTSGDWSRELAPIAGEVVVQPGGSSESREHDDVYHQFLRTYSALRDPCAPYEGANGYGDTMDKGNLYHLFLKTLYALPDVTDLLCSWYCVQRAAGFTQNLGGGPWVAPDPVRLYKVKTLTLRLVTHRKVGKMVVPNWWNWVILLRGRDTNCSLRAVMEAFPALECVDAPAMVGITGPSTWWVGQDPEGVEEWGDGPWLGGEYRQGVRRYRRGRGIDHIPGGAVENAPKVNPIRHVRVYHGCLKDVDLAAFCKVSPGLETLLVRFFKASRRDELVVHEADTRPSLDEGLMARRGTLRYLELVCGEAGPYLSRTQVMEMNGRLRRLTCLHLLDKLETLVVDFHGLFGEIPSSEFLGEQDVALLHTCLPPRLVSLKVFCVWSRSGGFVVSHGDVAMFLDALLQFHGAGLLPLADTLRKLVLVAPYLLKKTKFNDVRLVLALNEAKEYFERTKVEFVFEDGMDILESRLVSEVD